MSCCDGNNKRQYKMVIETPSRVKDAYGSVNATWSNEFTIWCSMEVTTNQERILAQQLDNPLQYKLMTRYKSAFDLNSLVSKRIVFKGQYFKILGSYDKDGDRKWITIIAEKTDSDGASAT